MGENFINALRDEGKMGMSEQWFVMPEHLGGASPGNSGAEKVAFRHTA